MAGKRKPKDTVPGLSFELSVRPLINGKPFEQVEPLVCEWNQSYACEWHEDHQDAGLRGMLLDVRRRVKAQRANFAKAAKR